MKCSMEIDGVSPKALTILEAAVRVLAVHGFEATKIEDVAREAGVGKGTVYEYFDSKEDLFARAVQLATRMYARILREALENGTSLRDALERSLLASLQFCETSRPVAQVLLDNPVGRAGASVREWLIDFRREMVGAIARTIRHHRGADFARDPEIAANVFLGALNNASLARILDDPEEYKGTVEEMARETLAVIMDGFGPDPARGEDRRG